MARIFFILALLVLLFPPISFAEIIQGNSSATVNVTTNVEGEGSVHTHIVTDVNGNTEVYDSSKSGSITIHQTASDSGEEVASDDAKASPSARPTDNKQKEKMNSSFQQFVINLQNFFKNLFHWF